MLGRDFMVLKNVCFLAVGFSNFPKQRARVGHVGLPAAGVLECASHSASTVLLALALPRMSGQSLRSLLGQFVRLGSRTVVLKASGLQEQCAGCG